MSSSTSHRHGSTAHQRGAHGGGGGGSDHGGGGGGGGGGKLVKVAFARNQAEAEMLQGLLSEEGIPSVLKRSGGFDNPDFLAAGPRDVMVAADAARRAREVLADTMVESEQGERLELNEQAALRRSGGDPMTPVRLAFWIGVAAIAAILIVYVVYQAT
ncbi:MAG: DUF2007 domain-containing protein [Solirubrobacterales bacterium]